MGNGYPVIQADPMAQFVADFQRLRDRVKTLEMPSGTQTYGAVAKVKEAINSIGTLVDNYLATGFTTGSMTATGDVTAGGNVNVTGTVTAAAGVSSVGAYNTDVSALPGARQPAWQHHSGVYGFAPSSRTMKDRLQVVPFTAADVLAVQAWMFQYKTQIALAAEDPDYVVPWEIGLMAEDLIAHNMGCFVFWNDDGTPRGINYDLFGAIAPLVVLQEIATHIGFPTV